MPRPKKTSKLKTIAQIDAEINVQKANLEKYEKEADSLQRRINNIKLTIKSKKKEIQKITKDIDDLKARKDEFESRKADADRAAQITDMITKLVGNGKSLEELMQLLHWE